MYAAGEFRGDIPLPDGKSLGERENNTELDAESRKKVLCFYAEDAPVGTFEAFLCQSAGRGRMDPGE